MNIAIVTYSLHIGGVEALIFNLAKLFIKEGHSVEIIETQSRGRWNNYFKENHLTVKTYKLSILTIPLVHVKRIIDYLQLFDVVLINDSPYAQAGIGLLHDKINIFPILHNNVDSMIKNSLASYGQWNKIICVSPKLKEIIDSHSEKELSVYIPNGVKPIEYVERNYHGKLHFLFVGRIDDKQKGVFLLPKIALSLRRKKIDFKIDIIGDGPSLHELERMIDQTKMSDFIILRKAQPHFIVEEIMLESHFLLLPSNYEGFGLVIIEAMSCGLIPIVSYLPGYTNICVKENITGFFGVPGKADSFVKAIEMAIANRPVLHQISKNASDLVSSKYSVSIMADAYLKTIIGSKELIKRNNKIDNSILPAYPHLPVVLGRIIRNILRLLSLNN
jgi:glycosyltransferase involved in cell wall biosynthesis